MLRTKLHEIEELAKRGQSVLEDPTVGNDTKNEATANLHKAEINLDQHWAQAIEMKEDAELEKFMPLFEVAAEKFVAARNSFKDTQIEHKRRLKDELKRIMKSDTER